MHQYIKIAFLSSLFLWSLLPSLSWADQVWGLEGVDIISREDRGAKERWKREDSGHYDRAIEQYQQYQAWLDGIGIDRGGKFARRLENAEREQKRRAFFEENYPQEIEVDHVVEYEGEHELWRPQSIQPAKTKLIIHHTAGDRTYETQADAYSGVRDIYKFHTLKNGRGDLGYNFLIDPFGNIYEGRAGGKGAIGAHAESNNVRSIGIALMGNYEVDEPTDAMIQALIRLSTLLAIEFDIEPMQHQPYFTPTSEDPFIEVHEHTSLVGHKDTKNTACPGHHVYQQLPEIRSQVSAYVNYFQEIGEVDFDVETRELDEAAYFSDNQGVIELPLDDGGTLDCTSLSNNVLVSSCSWETDKVRLLVKRIGYPASGTSHFIVRVGKKYYLLDASMIRASDLERLQVAKKNSYVRTFQRPATEQRINKISDKLRLDEARDLLDGDVDVLLYELTAQYDEWNIVCASSCDVLINGEQRIEAVTSVNIVEDKQNDQINVFVNLTKYPAERVDIINNGALVTVTNYPRAGNGTPRNRFRGDISIHKDDYKHLQYGWLRRYVVVNSLPVRDYLKGVGETSELQHLEKLKAMALLTKAYILFYLNGENDHPSIPTDATYNAVDDPRIFQKYVGAGRESYAKKWLNALRQTEEMLITYQGHLPILPYFHCSAGFTWSALEKFGRKDTPYLKSTLDVTSCATGQFEGHGVGLSGDGAQIFAENGATFQEILSYYYDGISIDRF